MEAPSAPSSAWLRKLSGSNWPGSRTRQSTSSAVSSQTASALAAVAFPERQMNSLSLAWDASPWRDVMA